MKKYVIKTSGDGWFFAYERFWGAYVYIGFTAAKTIEECERKLKTYLAKEASKDKEKIVKTIVI
jgi:hypothetical protein